MNNNLTFSYNNKVYKTEAAMKKAKTMDAKRAIKQIASNNSKHKLSCFITIKYLMREDDPLEEKPRIILRYFNSNIINLTSSHVISGFINNLIKSFEKQLEITENGSSLTFVGIEKLSIKTAKSKAMVGGSYIELPEFIKNKRACVNIKNDDEKCFKWSILASKHYHEMKGGCKDEAYSYFKCQKELIEPENVTYPLDIEFIPEFEKLNNLKVNVFELIEEQDEEENIKYATKILYCSYKKYKDVVCLLLFKKDDKQHFVWIKDINKLDKSNVATHASMYRFAYCLSARFMTKENLY
jgi:hypothetical protein